MRHARVAPGIIAVVLSMAAAFARVESAGAGEDDPYLVPREEVQRKVRTIALWPVILPAGTEDAEPIRTLFESLIVQKLQSKGFATVAPDELASVWRRMSERLGGVYDPLTGEIRKERYDAAWQHATRELGRRFGVDAVLEVAINEDDWLPRIKLGLGRDYYAVMGELITWGGEPIFASAPNLPQKLRGVALGVRLFDLTGTVMYAYSAGIEWCRIFVARSHEERPRREMYTSVTRNQGAVDRALGALVSVAEPAAPP